MALNSLVLAGRWLQAVYRFDSETETWNLLRPVDLMAYSLAASQDLVHSVDTKEHRRMEMRGKTTTVLREHPLTLLPGAHMHKVGSGAYSDTSTGVYDQIAGKAVGPGVSVRERQLDLESGNAAQEPAVVPSEEVSGGRENAN